MAVPASTVATLRSVPLRNIGSPQSPSVSDLEGRAGAERGLGTAEDDVGDAVDHGRAVAVMRLVELRQGHDIPIAVDALDRRVGAVRGLAPGEARAESRVVEGRHPAARRREDADVRDRIALDDLDLRQVRGEVADSAPEQPDRALAVRGRGEMLPDLRHGADARPCVAPSE